MKKLIIAEKPTLARTIVSAIGKSTFTNHDCYYENNDYIVTYAFGHLFSLKDLEEYLPDYDAKKKYKWKLDNLPFFPSNFQFKMSRDPKTGKVDDGIKKQVKVISDLCKRTDVISIINAGDSDREGEIIIIRQYYERFIVLSVFIKNILTFTYRHSLYCFCEVMKFENAD